MTNIVEAVRDAFDQRTFVKSNLRKAGCRVRMTDVPEPRLIIDLDKPGSPAASNAKCCDYLVFVEDQHGVVWVAPLELKRGKLHADQVARQLQSGAKVAENRIAQSAAVTFRPVAVTGSASIHERNTLKKNRVKFHGRLEPIRLMKCGTSLAQVLFA